MASTNADRKQVGRRRWRWIRFAVWTVALLWFAYYVHVRVSTPPAVVSIQQHERTYEANRQSELLELIQELPAAPPPTPTSGWWTTWSDGGLADGILSDWAPDPNSPQDVATKYINKPTTGKTLDEIVVFCARLEESPDEYHKPSQAPADHSSAQYSDPRYQDAIAALTFRARYRIAEKANVAGALADLRAAARIAMIQQQSRLWSVGWAGQSASLVQYELGCLAREVDLSPHLAQEMIGYLIDKLSLSVADAVIARTSADMQIDRLLDRYYTSDAHGNGWLVLSAASEQMTLFYGAPATARTRAWNVFSPLFSDRKAVRAKLLSLTEDLGQLDRMSYEAARRFLANRTQPGRGSSVLDGPLLQLTQGVDEYTFQTLFERVARRRALVVMLALSAFKHTSGEYPDTLDALAPDFLSAVPLDALSNRPFRYEKLPQGNYDLDPGLIEGEAVGVLHTWWRSHEAYRANSYVPQRSSKANPSQP